MGRHYWDSESGRRRRADGGSLVAAWVGFAAFAVAIVVAAIALVVAGKVALAVVAVIALCVVTGVVVLREMLERPPTAAEVVATIRRTLRP